MRKAKTSVPKNGTPRWFLKKTGVLILNQRLLPLKPKKQRNFVFNMQQL